MRGAVASPWPFVRALIWRQLPFELGAMAFAMLACGVFATSGRLELLLTESATSPADRNRLLPAVSLQLVSIASAVCALGWHMHLVRLLRGIGSWCYPALEARVRGAVLLLGAVLAVSTLLVAHRWHAWPEALALSAVSGAWAAWPLLLHVSGGLVARGVALMAPAVMTMLPYTSERLAGLLPWVAAVAATVAVIAVVRGISPTVVRAMVEQAQPELGATAWMSPPDEEPAAPRYVGNASALTRAQSMTHHLDPRWPVPPWMPAWGRALLHASDLVLPALIWYALDAQPALLLIAFASTGLFAQAPLWMPYGREERLAMARIITYRGMIRHGSLAFLTLLVLEALGLPQLPFGMSGPSLLENWLQLPLLIAMLPLVYTSSSTMGLARSKLGQGGRAMVAILVVMAASRWGMRHDADVAVLALSVVLLGCTLAEQHWRLTRYFRRSDLHTVPAL
jgi:hypothetical protein